MSNDKKDLTGIEDLGEFIHELHVEEEDDKTLTGVPAFGEESPSDFTLDLSEQAPDITPAAEEKSEIIDFNKSDLEFGNDEIPVEPKTETKVDLNDLTNSDFELAEDPSKLEATDTFNYAALTEETIAVAPKEEEEFKSPETFSDLKSFSEHTSLGGMATEGNPSFSVLIKNVRYAEDIQDIISLLRELALLQDTEEVIKGRLKRGMLLIPRISEYSAIFLSHKLRRFDIDIQIGLSDEIHPPKHQETPETGIVSKFNLFQNQEHHFHFDDPKLELSQIIVSATPGLEGYQVLRYIGVATEHKLLDSSTVEDEASDEIPSHYHELAQKLKAHALKAHSNAVVGLNYQLTPIPSEYGISGSKYRLTCTGNLVWVNKL